MRPLPRAPTVPLDRALEEEPRLGVRQARHLAEMLTGFERANRYAIHDERGALAGLASERGEGAGELAARWFLRGARPFRMDVYDAESPQRTVLRLVRPWRWFLARLEVADGEGRPVGVVRQRFSWLRRRLDLEDSGGRLRASLVGPILHPWTFRLLAGPRGAEREIGRIEKRWSGLLTEAFSTADTFLVTLPRGEPDLRRLVLAAAILVDFRWFERRD
ncbi:MAG TPA: phospholipid scramblase-related protein [Anaeromyxobacteraceae bacterium]|nr:phospholipid scramblase-related protein [Anaeromyxobacteraceae bacterium]